MRNEQGPNAHAVPPGLAQYLKQKIAELDPKDAGSVEIQQVDAQTGAVLQNIDPKTMEPMDSGSATPGHPGGQFGPQSAEEVEHHYCGKCPVCMIGQPALERAQAAGDLTQVLWVENQLIPLLKCSFGVARSILGDGPSPKEFNEFTAWMEAHQDDVPAHYLRFYSSAITAMLEMRVAMERVMRDFTNDFKAANPDDWQNYQVFNSSED